MDDTFLVAYERTVDALPDVLRRWENIDPILRSHYAGEVVRLLAERAGIRDRFRDVAPNVLLRLVTADTRLQAQGTAIAAAIGLRVADFLLPESVSVEQQQISAETVPPPPPEYSLAA